jgi:hypothetical protein
VVRSICVGRQISLEQPELALLAKLERIDQERAELRAEMEQRLV